MNAAVNIRAVNALIAQQRPEDRTDDLVQARADEIHGAILKLFAPHEPCNAMWAALPELTYMQAEYETNKRGEKLL